MIVWIINSMADNGGINGRSFQNNWLAAESPDILRYGAEVEVLAPDFLRQAVAAEAPCDAVVVSCTNLRCLDVIGQAEAKIGVPVISSNQAMAWHMLRLAGIDDTSAEFGSLFGHDRS